jgi:hypothetical protein
MVKGHPLRAQPDSLSDLSRPQLDDGTAQPTEVGGQQWDGHKDR